MLEKFKERFFRRKDTAGLNTEVLLPKQPEGPVETEGLTTEGAMLLMEKMTEKINGMLGKPEGETKGEAETDDSFPYHQAKEIIERARSQYDDEREDQELPPISFSRKEEDSKIKFEIAKGVDFPGLLVAIVQTLGNTEISSYGRENIYLSNKNGFLVYITWSSYFQTQTISFTTKKDLTSQEIEAVISAYKLSNPANEKSPEPKPEPKEVLESLGATIFNSEDAPAWDYLAGYEKAKQQVKDTIILPFRHPEIYEQIAQKTRRNFEPNRPKAVLLEGPPGTGKTTMARLIAGEVKATLVYVPIESIMSKWYGESEKNLATIFDTCRDLGNSLLFLDEIDSLATSRDGNIHEATRRVLSVLLRKIDGFVPNEGTILIAATNRKNDLDLALLSRFDTNIEFPLPNTGERQAIFENYAQHLDKAGLATLAEKGDGLSGRDIKNLCERAERSWASELIIKETELVEPPPLDNYLAWMEKR